MVDLTDRSTDIDLALDFLDLLRGNVCLERSVGLDLEEVSLEKSSTPANLAKSLKLQVNLDYAL